jgi:glyoxylase-like metal-dependent hydrolase (beta-lactamase superfamily II)
VKIIVTNLLFWEKNMEIINVGNRIINNYMIKLEKGYLLIDTGYPEQFNRFCRKLKESNIEFRNIVYVLLTHAHDDHAGFLNEILDKSDAKVILHSQAVLRLKKGQNCLDGVCTSYLALICARFIKIFGKEEHRFPPVDRAERYIILDEKNQPSIERELSGKIINLPGHSIDSIGLLLEDGSLFCGDAAMNGFPSKNRIVIWLEDMIEYIKSWEIMINCNPSLIFPAHGKPFIKEDLKKNKNKINKIKLYPLK